MREKVVVVGGGPSLLGFNFECLRNQDTIVVNKAIKDVPNPNHFITMDYTFLLKNREVDWKACHARKHFVVNLGCPYLKEIDGKYTDTRSANQETGHPGLVYDLRNFDSVTKSYSADGLGADFSDFRNGSNSGYCAFQLAPLLGYKKIYLLGIDLQAKGITHYHKGYGESREHFAEKLAGYAQSFVKGVLEFSKKFPQAKVFSCSKISLLNAFIPYVSIEEALR